MIPKKIHYIWLGGNPLTPTIEKCIKSWRDNLPGYEIICWNEKNINISDPIYIKTLQSKKWAFASDIARLHILYNHGGIYLDTDIEIIKDLSPLLDTDLFMGFEDNKHINAAIIASTPHNIFIKDSLDAVTSSLKTDTIPIPQIITKVYNKLRSSYTFDHKVYDKEYFYPYNPFDSDIKILFYSDITAHTYAIHHWGHSWKMGIVEQIIQKAKNMKRRLIS